MKAALIGLYLLSPLAAAGGDWTHVYDARFRDAALAAWSPERHVFWPALKAQAACESALRPDATSPVGAAGIAQFMPGTWQDVKLREGWPHDATPYDVDYAIRAQASEIERLAVRVWTSPRPVDLELEVVWASYNAGPGHVIKAQRHAHGARDWVDIAPYMHTVTGDHAKETLGYVECIEARWEEMTGLSWPVEALQ